MSDLPGADEPQNFSGGSHVVIDVCRAHGVWLDKDELPRIITFVRQGGMTQARADADVEKIRNLQAQIDSTQSESAELLLRAARATYSTSRSASFGNLGDGFIAGEAVTEVVAGIIAAIRQ